jgi:hypothetical protein
MSIFPETARLAVPAGGIGGRYQISISVAAHWLRGLGRFPTDTLRRQV